MSQTWTGKYNYEVCPYCKSKNITRVFIKRALPDKYYVDQLNDIESTNHFQCNNCKRVFHESDVKFRYDYAEMRRDIKNLTDFLAERTKKEN